MRKIGAGLLLACLGWLVPGAGLCALPGDCNGDNVVTIAEVQSAINMYLGMTSSLSCVDTDGSRTVSIAEVQQSINAFLGLVTPVYAKRVTGVVKDPMNGDAAAAGAVVSAYLEGSGTATATATVQSDGTYGVTGLSEGKTYNLVFRRTGYGDVTYYGVRPSIAAETVLQQVVLIPSSTLQDPAATAAVNGYVTNAADNKGIAYLPVRFRAGLNAVTGDYIAQSTSTKDGTTTKNGLPVPVGAWYRDYFPAGCYTAEVLSADGSATLGYFTVYAVPGVSRYNNSQSIAVPLGTGQADSYRVVLSWGNAPKDLDLHLTGPLAPGDTTTVIGSNDTPRFHIDSQQKAYPYDAMVPYSDPTVTTGTTDAYLDIDQANHGTDNGNETMTILTQRTGIYRFYVYNNSTEGTLSGSGATVKLYKGATLVNSFPVPALTGNTWHVFDLDGSTVTTVNSVSTVTPDQTYNLAKSTADPAAGELKLFKPIVKTAAPSPFQ